MRRLSDRIVVARVLDLTLNGGRAPGWVADALGIPTALVVGILGDNGWPDRAKLRIRLAVLQAPSDGLPAAAKQPDGGTVEDLLRLAASRQSNERVRLAAARLVREVQRLGAALQAADRSEARAARTTDSTLQQAHAGRASMQYHRTYDPTEVRAWARARGMDVPTVGRFLPKLIVDAFNEHRSDQP